MKWITLPVRFALGITLLVVCVFVSGVLWLLEYEDKKNPATLH